MTKTILTPFLVGLLFFCFVMAITMSISVGATIVSVSITPVSASIDIGESVVFNSTLMGASIPYWYTWFLNGTALSETGTSWNFTPSIKGTYNVYLKVYPSINDTDYNIAQSETAHLVVGGESFIGVLGYPKGSSQASGSGTQYTVDGSRFSLDVESNVTSMSCLMHYQTIPYDPTRNYTYGFAIYRDNNGMVGNLLAQTVKGTMYYFDNYGPMWYTLDFPSVIHLPPGAYWLVEVHNASGQIMVGSDVIDGYESVDSFISGLTFPASLPSPVTFSNYVFCIYASWAVNISASLSLENTDFSIVSNSTVSPLVYNSSTNEVNFNVSGLTGTVGYTEAFISKNMLPNVTEASIALDGKQHNFTATSLGDSWLLHFVYPHSTHNVAIRLEGNPIPEFSTPNLAILFLFAIIILATAVFLRKRGRSRSFVDLGFTK